MANDRLSALEAHLDERSEARDAEIHELAKLVARNGEITNSVASELARIRSDIGSLRDRQPGFLQLWGPSLLTISLVAGASSFMIVQMIKPVEHDQVAQAETINRLRETSVLMTGRQRENESILHYQRGRLDALQEQVTAIDNNGARYWVRRRGQQEP